MRKHICDNMTQIPVKYMHRDMLSCEVYSAIISQNDFYRALGRIIIIQGKA